MHFPKPICGPEFQLSKSRSTELYWEQAVSVPAPLNDNELHLSTPTWRALPATRPSQGEDASYVACTNAMVDVHICIAMARGDAFVQPYQFDPESDPEGEAPEEVQRKLCLSPTQSPNTWTLFASSLSPVCTFPDFLLWQPSSIVILLTLNSLQTALHSGPNWS